MNPNAEQERKRRAVKAAALMERAFRRYDPRTCYFTGEIVEEDGPYVRGLSDRALVPDERR